MKVYPDVNKSYFTAAEALEDNGFKRAGKGIMRSGKTIDVFKKDGKLYRYMGMEHFNSTIYQIDLKNVTNDNSIIEIYDFV